MDKVLGLVSIARKAGRAVVGEEPVSAAAEHKKARLILLASDAAANTATKAAYLAEKAGCPLFRPDATKEALGGTLGRASCAMVAITDMGLAAALAEKLAELDPETYGDKAGEMRKKANKMDRRKRETVARKKKRG